MSARSMPGVKWLVIWFIALVAVVCFHFAVVVRAKDNLETNLREVAVAVERYTLLRKAESPREQERLKERQGELRRQYTDLVFDSDGLGSLDLDIRRIAEGNGLSEFSGRHLATISAVGTAKLTRIAQRNLSLSCTGSFADVLRFINTLERHQPVVFVDQCILKATIGNGPSAVSCTILYSLLFEATVK